jgi:hypothetical protein
MIDARGATFVYRQSLGEGSKERKRPSAAVAPAYAPDAAMECTPIPASRG